MVADHFEKIDKLLRAISRLVRIAIRKLLHLNHHCIWHLESGFGFLQGYISQQLMALPLARIFKERRKGLIVFYQVGNPAVFKLLDAVYKL